MTTQAGLEQMVERVNGRAITNADAFLRMLHAIRRLPEEDPPSCARERAAL